jgi:hypothetical protein
MEEFAPEHEQTIVENIKDEIVEESVDASKEMFIEQFADKIQDWVTEEFAPEVQNWCVESFAPGIQNWIVNEYAPKLIEDKGEIEAMIVELCAVLGADIIPANRGVITKAVMPVLKKSNCDMKVAQSVHNTLFK